MKTPAKGSRRATAVVAAAPAAKSNKWIYVWGALAALIAACFAYGPALDGPFLLDDTYLPYMQSGNTGLSLLLWVRNAGVRPLLMASYWLNFHQSGALPGPYHFVNLVLHLLNGGLIFLVIRKVLVWAKTRGSERDLLSAFAAGLFLLHPLQTESVSYIASRSETLSVFFFLGAFAVFLYRRGASASIANSALVLLLFVAAVLSKEHAAILPALLLLTDYYWNPGFSFEGIRRNWKIYVPMIVAAAAGLTLVWSVLRASTSAGFGIQGMTWYQYFFTECRVIWRYVLLFVFPVGQNVDPDVPISRNVFEHGAIVGLIALLSVAVTAWVWRKRYPLESYGIFTFLMLIAPTSSFVPIQDPMAERRMYLPFIGLLLLTVSLLTRWKAHRSTVAATLAAVLLIEGVLAYQRNQLWSNAIALWTDSVSKSPEKFRPRFQLAYAEYIGGRCAEAVNDFAKTAQLSTKPDYGLLVDWALSYDCAGNQNAAIDKLKEAAVLEPGAHVYSQIGMEYAKQGNYPQALEVLDKAASLDPNWDVTYVYRGNIFLLQNNKSRAAEQFRIALALNGENETARDGLAKASQ